MTMKLITTTLAIACIFQVRSQTPNAVALSDSLAKMQPAVSVTQHSAKIGDKMINYTATAGTLVIKNEQGDPIALFGFTAYTKNGTTDATKRPVTFAYNGGPGSSSLWLHLGALGPRRVVIDDPTYTPAPPYKMDDNANSILDVSDIVMIDPVGTGLSHAIGKAKNKDFWGVDEDVKSISNFIKTYTTTYDRWNSPKYILGESYGTTRSAAIVDNLQENMGLQVNGVILVSVVLDFRTLTFQQGDDISYTLFLPTYAAVAYYHNKLPNKPANLAQFLQEARTFAGGEYATALQKGDELDEVTKEKIVDKLVYFTGLSKDYWLKANLKVTEPQFTQELLRNEHNTVGRLDARFKGTNQNLLSENASYDPQSSQISPAYTASFMNYFYGDLKVDKKYDYQVSAYGAEGFKWNWSHASNGSQGDPVTPNTGVDLADAMSKNPNLKVLVLNGYFDLATPFYATEYTFNHLGLEKNIKKNVSFKYFEAGHMMYVNPTCLTSFKNDIANFIESTTH